MKRLMEMVQKSGNDVNVMELAHAIRKELNLEGDYAAQMSYSLKKAHALKKCLITVEQLFVLPTTDTATDTTNANVATVPNDTTANNTMDEVATTNTNVSNNTNSNVATITKEEARERLNFYIRCSKIAQDKAKASPTKENVEDANKKTRQANAFYAKCKALFSNSTAPITNKVSDSISEAAVTSTPVQTTPNSNVTILKDGKYKLESGRVIDCDEYKLIKSHKYVMHIGDGIVTVINNQFVESQKDYNKIFKKKLSIKETEMLVAKNISKFPKNAVIFHKYNFFGKLDGYTFIKID